MVTTLSMARGLLDFSFSAASIMRLPIVFCGMMLDCPGVKKTITKESYQVFSHFPHSGVSCQGKWYSPETDIGQILTISASMASFCLKPELKWFQIHHIITPPKEA